MTALPGVSEVDLSANTARFRTSQPAPALARLTALLGEREIEIRELTVRQASLEDVFLELTSAQEAMHGDPELPEPLMA